jgi:tubulin-folding cofactor B
LQFLPNAGASQVLFDIPPNTDDNRMLGYYSLDHGVAVYCIDLDPHSGSKGGQYEDTSLVKKYKMSDEEYNKRQGTLRDWGRQQKEKDSSFTLAKHAKQHRELADANRQAKLGLDLPKGFEYGSNGKAVRVDNDEEDPAQTATENKENEFGIDTVEGIGAGMRCEVRPGTRRGAVAFVGEIPELGTGGYWIGIVFDEPVGKTDGTTKGGKRYFTAPGSNYGGFVRGKNVEIGDFPERDIMDELDDSDDEL